MITKDQEVCGKHNLVDESLVVNGDNQGIANVVVFLALERRQKAPKVHPSYESDATGQVEFDNHNCRFEPHVTLLRTTQSLLIGNKDPVGHNTKVDTLKNPAINPIVPAGGEMKQKFSKEERLPCRVSCNIHPWMTGWLLVKETPYIAVSDADGRIEIKNVPAGQWTFQVWHEFGGGSYVTEVTLDGKNQKWKKGKWEIDVQAGDNDFGTIAIPASFFKK